MQTKRDRFSDVWKEEEELLRPFMQGGRDAKIGMGGITKKLHTKLNRSVGLGTRSGKNKITNRGGWKRGNVFDYNRGYSQRVVVKSHVVKHIGTAANAKTLRSHTYYLARDGVGVDGEKPDFYSATHDHVTSKGFVTDAKNDPHHFRVIISPENATEIQDMNSYVRDVMGKIEEDLGTEMDWMAVNHFNTDNPHAHVIIRGRDKLGKELRITRDYISHGMRERAQEVATNHIGERTYDQVQEAKKREVYANRVTSLDYKIEALAGADRVVDVRLGNKIGYGLFEESLLRGRIAHLKTMGLVTEKDIGVFAIEGDFKDTLFQASKRGDIIKTMYDRIGKDSANMNIVDLRNSDGKEVAGIVMDKGPVDELNDRYYVIVKDSASRPHYINIGNNRNYTEIQKGAIINVKNAQASTGKADYNIAALAAKNDGVYNQYKHYAEVEETLKWMSDDERQSYVDRHMIRLQSLEKSGIVERINEISYKVPNDLVKQSEKVTEEINEKLKRFGVADVSLVSEQPLIKQEIAEAWTDLDSTITKRAKGEAIQDTGWREFEASIAKRTQYLKENGYAKEIEGKLVVSTNAEETLKNKELLLMGDKLEKRFKRIYTPNTTIREMNGVYRGKVKLHSGNHAVVTTGQKVTLVPLKGNLKANVGQEINIKMTKKGVFRIRSREIGMSL